MDKRLCCVTYPPSKAVPKLGDQVANLTAPDRVASLELHNHDTSDLDRRVSANETSLPSPPNPYIIPLNHLSSYSFAGRNTTVSSDMDSLAVRAFKQKGTVLLIETGAVVG